ncbi:type VI secretion system tip protein VgrG [Limnobaculum zhutongyuii]|uniref:Type VI secretion system tip protein VgrG n=1 Tax=Limnobaculum zhutongyuii TaxID=2498113 RepID=A0A411WLH6_9GAMM|nr:type VI secretion system tip protein TssI/VgrG [Limnobaculum zhutongyuii]QBH97018.1 type VI secretion system tip protein VgrG [Limnobaculum zhutongyuii]TQS87432.1 type VI secretion system tip protein VgrG [Limnobaculum zhutongyuii]
MDTGLYFSCKIGSLPETTFDVVDFTLEEALSTLFTLELTVASNDASIDMDEQLLQKASLTVMVDGAVKRTVNGIVAAAFQGDSGFKRTYYNFIIRPEMWLLTLVQDNRIFHFKSIPDILDELLKKHSVRVESKLIDAHKQWEYTTQRNETDYDFFCRLAAEEGIVFWFEENSMFYSDSRTGMKGGETLLYNAHIQSASREAVIHRLRYGAKMTPNAVHLKDYKFSHPDVGMDSKTKNLKKRPAFTVYDSYGRYDDDGVAQQYAKYRLEAYQADSLSGKAESNTIQMMPGKIFTITEHTNAALNDSWQVVNIIHKGSLPQPVADESVDKVAAITNSFSFIPGSVDWRPPFIAKPTVHGDETATVVGPAGEEIYVNEYGQVKIHFHWNKYDAPDENASCWVRTSQAWNGDGFGMMAIPRIGQEVVITYINGDIDQPMVLGTSYNGKNSPPLDLPAAKTQTSFKSKTHKGGGFNELRFEDSDGQQQLFMHAQKDMNTSVRNNRTTDVDMDHTENIGQHQTVNVTANQSTNVGGNQSIDVTGDRTDHVVKNETTNIDINQTLTVGGDQSITVTKNRTDNVNINETVEIGANQDTTIKGNHTVKVTGTQDITVTGAENTTYQNLHNFTVNGNHDAKFLSNQVLLVQGTQTTTVNGTKTATIHGLMTENFQASHNMNVTGSQTVVVTAAQNLQSQTLTITAADQIVIGCGSSQITMDSAGNIQIMGVKITVVGQSECSTVAPKVHSNGMSENIVEGAVVKLNP